MTRAWRDDSVIFARLRPSAPQMVESWLAARVREEERRASAPGPSRLSFGPAAPRETRRAPTCDAARRANVRAGAPGECGREARERLEASRSATRAKRPNPRNRRRITERAPKRLQKGALFSSRWRETSNASYRVRFQSSTIRLRSQKVRLEIFSRDPPQDQHSLLKIRRNRGARAFGFARSGARARRRRR